MLAKTISTFVLLILIGTVILGGIYLFDSYFIIQEANKTAQTENPDKCTILGGKFIEGYNECEEISKDACDSIGGAFEECASACRHDSGDVICTMQCVPVCSL